jgi:dolichol-phosphate mannosyltransferase
LRAPVPSPTYSVVVPVFNEEEVLSEFCRRIGAVADGLEGPSEFIFVDDGSSDRSRELLIELRQVDPRIKVASLSRNFGHQVAISAGLDLAQGDAVVILDADLQDPPEVVPRLVERWREGYDVVYAVRNQRAGESRFKRATASLFYRLLSRASDVKLPRDTGDFRLVDRRVADVVRGMREPDRYLRGMFAWVGFRQAGVPYERAERMAGETKFSLSQMMRFAADGIIGFSTIPLRFALGFGGFMAALAFSCGAAAVILKLTGSYTIPGWASITVLLSFFSGMQLLLIGVLGQYIGRIYQQGKQRPLYLVAETHGLGGEEPAPAAQGSLSLENVAKTRS